MDIFERIKVWAGACAANTELQNLRDAAKEAERTITIAEGMSSFTNANGDSIAKLGKAKDLIGKIGGALEKVNDTCLDIKAVGQIHSAIKILNQDGIINDDPDKAARAFGTLFVGFGRLAKHLPPPVNSYAMILEGCGDFFYNMRQKLDPERRWQKQFREIEGFY